MRKRRYVQPQDANSRRQLGSQLLGLTDGEPAELEGGVGNDNIHGGRSHHRLFAFQDYKWHWFVPKSTISPEALRSYKEMLRTSLARFRNGEAIPNPRLS